MNSSKVRYRLSPNEEAGILQQERDRRRKLRIQQVREQERAFAKHIRDQVEVKKQQELKVLAMQLKDEWMIAKEEEQQALKDIYQKTLDAVGEAHLSAEIQPPYDKIRKATKVENDRRAKRRGQRAFQKQQEEDEKKLQEEFALVMARKTALEIERARAALIAKKPSRKSDLDDAEVIKPPTRVLHQDGFSTSHYTIPTEYAERADIEEQGDAKQAAKEEEKRMKEEMKEKRQELDERKTKASLRQKHAQEKEELEKDLNHLLEELGQMEQADRRRRQLIVSTIPKQIFVPPHRRLEEKEENQKDLEAAFENMYMAKTDYAGDIELALEPALPQVEADLDLSSDTPEEHFKIPEKTEPKRFPQGLDATKKMSPTGKRDSLRKLLLKVQSQKHDHKLRKKTDISQQIVADEEPSQESVSTSEVTESVVSSGITPSSVTTESTSSKTSSTTQTSSNLSQHPLSSSETESMPTSSVSGSLETGPISDESSSNGKSTLMHPLEAAYIFRKNERDEESAKMRNHDMGNQEPKYEVFHRLEGQATFPEKILKNMRNIQPQNDYNQDQNLNYEEEQKFMSESDETLTLQEIRKPLDKSQESMKGQLITVDVKVPSTHGYRSHKEGDTQSSGSVDFQPLHPSHTNSLSPEPQHNIVTGSSGVGQLHEGLSITDVASNGENVIISGRKSDGNMQKADEGISRRFNRDLSKESSQQTDVLGRVNEVQSQISKKQVTSTSAVVHERIHSSTRDMVAQGRMPKKFGGRQSGQLVSDLSPSQLESVRRAYPNIYEAVTGKNRNEADSDVGWDMPLVGDSSPQMTEVIRMTGDDVRVGSEVQHVSREVPSEQIPSFFRTDGTGSKVVRPETGGFKEGMGNSRLEFATGDVDKGLVTDSEGSDTLTDPSEEFRSSLHDYQEQLLKLQRTNELQLLEAQAQLQQRRQRLMDLYPQIQLPAYKPFIPEGYREVAGSEETRGGSYKENKKEDEKGSGMMDLTVNGSIGRKMNLESGETHTVPTHQPAGPKREERTDRKGYYLGGTSQNTEKYRKMNSGLQGSHVGFVESGITTSAFVRSSQSIFRGGKIAPLQDVLRGSNVSDHGSGNLQSFNTPPIPSERTPSTSSDSSTNFQYQPSQMGVSQLHEEQKEPIRPMHLQESWGTPHVHGEGIGQAISNESVVQTLIPEIPETRDTPSRDGSENSRSISSPEVDTMLKKNPHGVWRPVRELRVSLPSVEMLEQSPLTAEDASLFSEQGSSFTKTPSIEFPGPSVGPPPSDYVSKHREGQQVLLTPRKLAQLEAASPINLPVDKAHNHEELKVNHISFSQAVPHPQKLITPSMLVGGRVETKGTLHTHFHEETKIDTSFEGATNAVYYMDTTEQHHSDQHIPQYREENKMTSCQETSVNDFANRLESQRYFQKFESFKRDLHSQEMNQVSKSSPELISSENVAGGMLQSQMMSTHSLQSQSDPSLDKGTFSRSEKFYSFNNQEKLFHEEYFEVQNRREEKLTQGLLDLGQATSRYGGIRTGFDQNAPNGGQIQTSHDQIQNSYNQIGTSFGQFSADKLLDDANDSEPSSKLTATLPQVTATLPQVTAPLPQDISGSGHGIEQHHDETHGENSSTNLEEPTDRGLLEALKNLMLAKARNKVPGTTSSTTSYFTHLDLTSSGSEKDENEGLKSSDVTSRVVFGTGSETGNTKGISKLERSSEELNVPVVRHRIHHKPPVANQSKLLALEEMAPHELSTIIEVETPVFENLPTFPLFEVEKEVQRFQNATHQSFDEGATSSSEWGTPHHHTPGSSQGSGSTQSQDIYIHQPMMVSSVEEFEGEEKETLLADNSKNDDVMGKKLSERDLSITSQPLMKDTLMTSSFNSSSSQIGALKMTNSKDSYLSSSAVKVSALEENLDDMTLSEGPISTSSENSFIKQVTEQIHDAGGNLQQDPTSNDIFPLSSKVLKVRSPRQERRDQNLVTSEDSYGFQNQGRVKKSVISNSATSVIGVGMDYDESKGETESLVLSIYGGTIEPENGDLTLEEGPLQETLTGDSEVEMQHPDSRTSFQIPSQERQDPSKLDGGFSLGLHSQDKTPRTSRLEDGSLQISEGSHQGFFADVMGHYDTQQGGEDQSHGLTSFGGGANLEQATSEAGIMEEPELTFQTTFDTNMTLESVQEVQQDEMTSNPSDSLMSFIRHEEQFAHSTPLKVAPQSSPQNVKLSSNLNQGMKEPTEPLTLQEALARHKSSFIKASQARQKEVKVQASTKSQVGTAFALTIKNWQKAKLEAQQKSRTKGKKKQTERNKENLEMRPKKEAPQVKTSEDRKIALKADKERTKRLYNQLEEVRQRKIQSERQKTYAENRQKRKEYEEKLKQRQLQRKNQLQKT